MDAYVHHVFHTSVQSAFEEFRHGFFQVCEASAVKLFRPEELQGIMVGSENYDWAAFKQVTQNPGFSVSQPVFIYLLWGEKMHTPSV